jgi:hypothetical protein
MLEPQKRTGMCCCFCMPTVPCHKGKALQKVDPVESMCMPNCLAGEVKGYVQSLWKGCLLPKGHTVCGLVLCHLARRYGELIQQTLEQYRRKHQREALWGCFQSIEVKVRWLCFAGWVSQDSVVACLLASQSNRRSSALLCIWLPCNTFYSFQPAFLLKISLLFSAGSTPHGMAA